MDINKNAMKKRVTLLSFSFAITISLLQGTITRHPMAVDLWRKQLRIYAHLCSPHPTGGIYSHAVIRSRKQVRLRAIMAVPIIGWLKTNAAGTLEWQKSLGGKVNTNMRSLSARLPTAVYIVAGYSGSGDGDISNPHWII
jgi:hypothetical protein